MQPTTSYFQYNEFERSEQAQGWLFATCVMQLADASSTLLGHAFFGHVEANPLMAMLIEVSPSIFVILKVLALPFILTVFWTWLGLKIKHERWMLAINSFFVGGNLITLYAVISNVYLMLK